MVCVALRCLHAHQLIRLSDSHDFLAIDRGQSGIPVGLKSADSLAQQDQLTSAGLAALTCVTLYPLKVLATNLAI